MSLLRGNKFSDSHQTYIPESEGVLVAAKNLESVTKIVLSVIVPVKSGAPRLKISSIPAGIKCVVRGRNAQQDFFIYTKEPSVVRHLLQEMFG
ncbi:MAG: hypothetical protein WC763_04515 [Candidatus Paceibacterota bacterium]|jgi:hypothetical protein